MPSEQGPMNIVFRVDASNEIGTGHIIRCLTLADELKRNGRNCFFICRRFEGNLIETIKSRGFEVHELGAPSENSHTFKSDLKHGHWLGATQLDDFEEASEYLNLLKPDVLIIDHYAIDETWEKLAHKHVNKILVIDDLADRKHDCDILLDQNWFGDITQERYDDLVSSSTIKLIGPKYALLRPEYALLRSILPPRDGIIRRILVFMGGSDPSNETGKVLEALSSEIFGHLAVDVVIGVNHPCPDDIKNQVAKRKATTLYQNLPSLAGLMFRADLMIGAGGSTTWERMCLGLPALLMTVAENQTGFLEILDKDGYINYLGKSTEVSSNDITGKLKSLLPKGTDLKHQIRKSQKLLSGNGVSRVTQTIRGWEI